MQKKTVRLTTGVHDRLTALLLRYPDARRNITGFCEEAVAAILDMMEAPPGDRTVPPLVQLFDVFRTPGPLLIRPEDQESEQPPSSREISPPASGMTVSGAREGLPAAPDPITTLVANLDRLADQWSPEELRLGIEILSGLVRRLERRAALIGSLRN